MATTLVDPENTPDIVDMETFSNELEPRQPLPAEADQWTQRCRFSAVRIDMIGPHVAPRLTPFDPEIVDQLLADSEENWPTVALIEDNYVLVDGRNVIEAARRAGRSHVRARIFDGNDIEAFDLVFRHNDWIPVRRNFDDRVHAVKAYLTRHSGSLRSGRASRGPASRSSSWRLPLRRPRQNWY